MGESPFWHALNHYYDLHYIAHYSFLIIAVLVFVMP